MIRLIASDLDGTLLTPSGTLPEGTFEVIRALKEKGIRFAPASGRQYDNLRRLFWPVRNEIAFICENGALTAAEGEKLPVRCFPEETARAIIGDILNSGMEPLLSLKDMTLVLDSSPRSYTDDIIYRLRNTAAVVHDPFQYADEYIKISGFRKEGVADIAAPIQEKWSGSGIICATAGHSWLDFTLNTKADGLRALCKRFGIAPEETAAFGDQQNDVPMLELAGHPYLMASGNLSLRTERMQLCTSVLDSIRSLL